MGERFELFQELLEHIRQNKEWWLIPVILMIIISWLLLTTAGQSSVPIFIYPMA